MKKDTKPEIKTTKKRLQSFEITHDQILKKAMDVFSKKGFKGATTRELAIAAEVNEVTLYRHFESKEAIFIEIAKRFTMVPVLENMLTEISSKPLAEKLRHIVVNFFKIYKERGAMIRIIFSEAVINEEEAKMFFENMPLKVLGLISVMFEREMAAGNIKKANPNIIARLFLGTLFSYNVMHEMFCGKQCEQLAENEAIETIINLYLKGLEKEDKK